MRGSNTCELVFQDCRIPKDRLLPGVKGLRGPFSCLNNARFGISWGALGAAMACYHSAVEYSKTRIQFDKPIASFQLIQMKLAWMLREITKGQLLALHAGRIKANGILDEYPVMRHMANLESVYTYEGTHDIHNLILGRWITGIQAFT